MNIPPIISDTRKMNTLIDNALKEHYRATMDAKRVPSDYLLMFTEGGEANAIADAVAQDLVKWFVEWLENNYDTSWTGNFSYRLHCLLEALKKAIKEYMIGACVTK